MVHCLISMGDLVFIDFVFVDVFLHRIPCDFCPFQRGEMTEVVRVSGIYQDLHWGHDMPFRARAYR